MSTSLRLRIIVASITVVIMLNVATTAYLHAALEKTLLQDAEAFLRAKAHSLAAILESTKGDVTSLRAELEWQPPSSQYSHVYTRLLDTRGQMVAETYGSGEAWPLAAKPVLDSPRLFESLDGSPFLELSTAAHNGTLVVAINLSRQYETLQSQQWILLILAAISIGALTLLAVIMSRLAIAPIQRLVQQTRELLSGDPAVLTTTSYPLELQPLVIALKDLHAELADQIQTLSRFSESVAHELRNPINILTGEAELTLSRQRTHEEYQDTLRSALEEYRGLSQLIESLLFIARAENHAETIKRTPLDAHQLAEDVLDFYRPLAEDKSVTLQNNIARGTTVQADALLVKRALGNLIANAIQHGAAKGTLSVDAEEQAGGEVQLRINNDGPVLDEAQIAKLFERFYRVDPSRSPGSGNGLGLSIVKGIMTLHGGDVRAYARPGKGMTFVLVFVANHLGPVAT